MTDLAGSKVLVTGADGFIGSHLVEALMAEGCDVRAFVYYNSFNQCGWLDTLPIEQQRELDVFAGDIRDANGVRQATKGCDVVFHLAALIGIPFSYHSPGTYVETNVNGTLNVLQAAQEYEIARLLVTSTSEVYGSAEYVPIDEQHPMQGQSPYSATKIGADRLSESFYRSFDTPVVIVRPFNTYGPRQSARAVIPTIITQLLNDVVELNLGSTTPTRDFNYVKDTAQAYLSLATADDVVGQEFNVATGTEWSIGDVAQMLIDELNPEAQIVLADERMRPNNSEVVRLVGDSAKLRNLGTWAPQYDLREGLRETVNWFSIPENLAKYKAWRYNV